MKFDLGKLSSIVCAFNDYAGGICEHVDGEEFRPFKLYTNGDEQRIYFLTIVLWTSLENIPFVVGPEVLRQHLEFEVTMLCQNLSRIKFA